MGNSLDWPVASPPQRIAPGQVHVWAWLFDAATTATIDSSSLDSQELQRLHRFHFAIDQNRFAITHRKMRAILAAYLDCKPAEISYRAGQYGKPELAYPGPLHFNLSHSRTVALLAISTDTEVGVDIEDIKPIEPEVAAKYFSGRELTALASLHDDAWLDGFYRCWTRKEAIVKAEGVGLHLPLACFDVTLAPDEPAQLLDTRPPVKFRHAWTLHHLPATANTVAALATGNPQSTVSCFLLQ